MIAPERRAAWTQVLQMAFAFLMRDIPTGARLKFYIRSFDEICKEIPTSLLVETMTLSLETAGDYWDGKHLWQTFRQSPTLREKVSGLLPAASESTRKECQMCFGSGFKIIEQGRHKGTVRCDHQG